MTESSAGITSNSFMNRHDLVPDVTTRYEVECNEEMLVTDLTAEAGMYGPADEDDDTDEGDTSEE